MLHLDVDLGRCPPPCGFQKEEVQGESMVVNSQTHSMSLARTSQHVCPSESPTEWFSPTAVLPQEICGDIRVLVILTSFPGDMQPELKTAGLISHKQTNQRWVIKLAAF